MGFGLVSGTNLLCSTCVDKVGTGQSHATRFTNHGLYHIVGKLSREKTFTNFAIFQPSAKVSPQNSWHATPIMQPVLTFHEMLLSYRSAKVFSLVNFPLYGR